MREEIDISSVRAYLALWRCKAQEEHPESPLRAAMLSSEVPSLCGRGTLDGVGVPVTIVSKVSGTLDWSRNWGGDSGGAIARLSVNTEISTANYGTEI